MASVRMLTAAIDAAQHVGPGTRVRLSLSNGETLRGSAERIEDDAVMLIQTHAPEPGFMDTVMQTIHMIDPAHIVAVQIPG